MADPIESARIKLARANLHAGVARREARRFFNRHPEPTFRIDPHGEQGDLTAGSVFGCKIVVARGWPDLPTSFAARFGDAIQNYRAALDHVAWRLVSQGLTPPDTLTERQQARVQFPIYTEEKSFRDNIRTRLPGVDSTVGDFIKARHKYAGGQATNDGLRSIPTLSNDDKHRALTIIWSAFLTAQNNVTLTNCELVSYLNPPTRPAVKDDAVVALMECRVTRPNPRVSMKFRPSIEIIVEDRGGFGYVLDDIRREVAEILDAPEILAAVS